MKNDSNDNIPAEEMALATLVNDSDRIRQDNARFSKMTAAQKRVTIAKDVLVWLSIGKIRAFRGTYLTVKDYAENYVYQNELEATGINGHTCTACALGAVFAVSVERNIVAPIDHGAEEMRHRLRGTFSLAQLRSIERAF